MSSDDLQPQLQQLLAGLRQLKRSIEAVTPVHVATVALRNEARDLSTTWRKDIAPRLRRQAWLDEVLVKRYDDQFTRLQQLSISPNRRATYLTVLESICKAFRKDLIIPSVGSVEAHSPGTWDTFLSGLPTSTESDYFEEAVSCAKANYFRAATVVGWCACIDHIHRKIAAIGFLSFSKTSERLAAQTSGRFKRFTKKFSINSLSELRATVFDDDVLTIVEGMGLIDNNQYRRLRACFDLRNQAAHPGDAPITEYNLMSYFSDIVQIVLSNPVFDTVPTADTTSS